MTRILLYTTWFSLLFVSHCEFLSGQTYISRWQYSWGGDRHDALWKMIPLDGNKYFFAGTSASNPSCTKTAISYGSNDFAIVEFDDAGNKLLEKTYGGDRWDQLRDAVKVSTGGYILTGETESGPSGIKTSILNGVDDIWVVRIDDNGNLLWERSYGGIGYEGGIKILETPDGGFLIAGISLSNIPGYNFGVGDYSLTKIDVNGNQLWSKLYGGTSHDEVYGFIAASDGNYFLCGTSESPVSGNKTSTPLGGVDVWLVKVSPDGTKLWDKSFGTAANDYRGNLLSLQDNNFLIIESAIQTGRIRKTDVNGNQIWLKTCSGNDQDFFETATEDLATGNIYVAGTSKTNSFGCKTSPYNGGGWFGDIWIAVFDSSGNKVDDMDFGGNDHDAPLDITYVNDEIWITGGSTSPMSGNKTTDNCGQTGDGWLIRLSKKFYINNQTPNELCNSQSTMKVHFTTTLNFNPGNTFTVQLSDANGNFSVPLNIGSLTGIKTDSIVVTIPNGLPVGPGYKIRVIGSLPADTTAAYSFWLHGTPVINLGTDTTICENTALALHAGPQPPSTVYSWSTGISLNNIMVSNAGLYWCEVQSACGIAKDTIVVQIKSIPVTDIGSDLSFCDDSSVLVLSNPQLQDVTYLWSNGNNNNSIYVQAGGTYWLKISNSCGSSIDTLLATEFPLPAVNLDKRDFLCVGSSRVLDAGNGFRNYSWNNGASSSSITVTSTGLFAVTVIDHNGCQGTDTTTISQMISLPAAFLPPDTAICSYQDVLLKSNQTFSGYLWNTGSISNSIVVKQPATYLLEVKNDFGCVGKDTIIVGSKECPFGFYMPTAFTPNNDGKNDLCRPILFGNVLQYEFTLYNRWGEKVFATKDRQKGWDGKNRGVMVESAIFIWTCRYQFPGEKETYEKGTIMLIR